MRRLALGLSCFLMLWVAAGAVSLQVGAFKHRSLSDIEKSYQPLIDQGFKLKIYQKGEMKKVVVEVDESRVPLLKSRYHAIQVDEDKLLKEGFRPVALLRKKRIPLSKVVNRLVAVKVGKDGIKLFGSMPWEYVETARLEDPERVVVRLFNAKNASGVSEMLVTPIPSVRRLKILYYPKDLETDVVLYPEGKVAVKILKLGKLLKVIPEQIAPEPAGVQVGTNKLVSLEFKDADVRDVINILSEVSGINFVIDPEVKGTVTIKLRNVPWRKALDVILKVSGLGMIDEGHNIIRIGPVDKINRELAKRARMKQVVEETAPVFTKIFELDYAKASEVKDLVKSMLTGKGKGVDVIERLNALLVKGTREELKKIENFLKRIDKPIPQVQISARIVEVATTRVKDLGIVWGIGFKQQNTPYNFPYTYTANANFDLGFNPNVGETPAGTLIATLLNRSATFSLNIQLSSLESTGLAKVISNPKVITMDNREAEISQGYEVPYSTYSDQGTNVEFKEAKLKLKVTPHITSKGDIILDIEVDKDSPDFTHMTPDGVPIQTRSVKTRVRLQSGETLVIGGVYEMTEQNTKRGVPYLDRVPLVKWLFGKEYRNVDKKELLIFITPQIVRYEKSAEETGK